MATQQENAIINLVINGEAAISTYRDLNRERERQFRLVQQLDRTDPTYARQLARLEQLNAAQRAWRQEITNTGQANQQMTAGFSQAWNQIKNIAAGFSLGALISKGVTMAIGAVTNLINGSEAAYTEAQKTQSALQNTLKTTQAISGQTTQSLQDMQSALMDQTGVDDDVIAKGEQMLLTFTNIRGKIYEQALPAIVDMTSAMNQGAVTMEGIQTTSIQVGKALNDPIKGVTALAKVGVSFDAQQKEQIRTLVESNRMMDAQAIILKELQKEFGGTATAIANTDVGAMQKFNTRVGNIQESIGKWIVTGKTLAVQVLDPFLSWLEKATGTSLPDKLREEQAEMNVLVGAIVSCNNNQKIRNSLISELQSKYPDFLGNIRAEDAANDLLLRRLTAVNEQYKERIFIAVNEDRIKDIQTDRTKAVKEEVEARKILSEQTGKSAAELAKLSDAQLKQLAKDNIQKQIEATRKDTWRIVSGEGKARQAYETLINGGKKLQQTFKDEAAIRAENAVHQDKVSKMELADIDKEIAAIEKKKAAEKDAAKTKQYNAELDRLHKKRNSVLGIVETPTAGPSGATVTKTENAAAKLKKIVQDMHKEFEALDLKDAIDKQSKNEQEIKQAEETYNARIRKAQELLANEKLTGEQRKQIEGDIAKAIEERDANTVRIKTRQNKEMEDAAQVSAFKELEIAGNLGEKLRALREELSNQHIQEVEKERQAINRKYQAMFDDLEGNLDAQLLILDEWDKTVANHELNAKKDLEEDKQTLEDEYQALTGNKHDLELNAIKAKYQKQREALQEKYKGQLQDTQQYQDALALINKTEKAAIQKSEDQKKKEIMIAAVQAAQEVSNAVFSIGASNRQAELDDALSKLQRQRTAELSNKNLSEAEKSAINAKYDKKEREEKLKKWKADQKAAKVQAAINTALAVTMALATTPWPLSLVTAGAALAAGIAQQVAIGKQKPPEFATGGILPDGPSHSAGGMNVVDPLGNLVANIEGGEPILSKATARANPNLVQALLASGGQTINYERILQARKVTNNGTTTPVSNPSTPAMASASTSSQQNNAEEMAELRGMIKDLTLQIGKSDSKPVVNSYRLQQDDARQLQNIYDAVNG